MTQCSLEALRLWESDAQPTDSAAAVVATISSTAAESQAAVLEELERVRAGLNGIRSAVPRSTERRKAAEKGGWSSYCDVWENQVDSAVIQYFMLASFSMTIAICKMII